MRREKLWHLLVGGIIALLVIVPLSAYAFVNSGLFNAAASHPHTKFTDWITHTTMIHSVRRHSRAIAAPGSVSAGAAKAGFCLYETHCV